MRPCRSMRYFAGQYWFEYARQVAKSLSSATGIAHAEALHGRTHVVGNALERELGAVHADDREPGLRGTRDPMPRGGEASAGS